MLKLPNMLKVVNATVIFADLNGFTEIVKGIKRSKYVDFMYQFRKIIYQAVKRYLAKTYSIYGFWGDEIKIVFYSPNQVKNIMGAIACSIALQNRWFRCLLNQKITNGVKSRFKIGIATDKIAIGTFPGATTNEIEGLPLCTARSLSKQAKYGVSSLIFIDSISYKLINKKYPSLFFHRHKKYSAHEINDKRINFRINDRE